LIFLIAVLLLVGVSTKTEAINLPDMITCEAGYELGEESNKCESVCNVDDEIWDIKTSTCFKTECEEGYNLTKGKCVEIVCQAGYALSESFKCESVCDLKEERWDTKLMKCIKHKCGHGFKYQKGKCVEIVCQVGYALSETGKEC